MLTTQMEERVAILLNLFGDEVAQSVLDRLEPERRAQLRQCLSALESSPPTAGEIEEVVGEFRRFFRLATAAERAEGVAGLKIFSEEESAGTDDESSDTEKSDAETNGSSDDEEEGHESFVMTDDPIADLKRLKPFQIAGALRDESPRTIAVVVNCLRPEMASETLADFVPEIRSQVFLQMSAAPRGATPLVKRIVRTTVERGCTVRRDPLAADREESDRRIAELLRSMPRKQRGELLVALEDNDPDTATRIKEHLYVFDELANVEDSSLQKLLREVELSTLARALQKADAAIVDKVKRNLSNRARESLAEEIELSGSLSGDDRDLARAMVVAELARLDQSGQLTMVDD